MNSKQEYAAKLCPLIMTSDAKQFLFLLQWTRNNMWKKYRNSVKGRVETKISMHIK